MDYFRWIGTRKTGKLYLENPQAGRRLPAARSQLPYGLGSNDVGLDRGQLGRGHVVHFSRVGGKVLLVEPNMMHRSSAAAAEGTDGGEAVVCGVGAMGIPGGCRREWPAAD